MYVFDSPRLPLRRVRNLPVIVTIQSLTEIVRTTRVKVAWVAFALQNIDISETAHLPLLACRAIARNKRVPWTPRVRLRQGYGATAFALHYVASEGWRRGELNPCPRRYPRKYLHVYPAISFKEPNLAPAHCRLPSVHEFPSPSGAVAPPFD